MNLDLKSSPNNIPWPPIILVGAAAAALILERLAPGLLPWPLAGSGIARNLGRAIMVAGAGLDIWSIFTMWRQQTNILPHRAAEKIVTSGPFSFSRNPIYLGNTLLLAGAAPAFEAPWFLLCALAGAVLFHVLAIRREEVHMAAKFGAAWDDYAASTPRWVWKI